MARTNNLSSFLSDIGDAIRQKDPTQPNPIAGADMDTAILGIQSENPPKPQLAAYTSSSIAQNFTGLMFLDRTCLDRAISEGYTGVFSGTTGFRNTITAGTVQTVDLGVSNNTSVIDLTTGKLVPMPYSVQTYAFVPAIGGVNRVPITLRAQVVSGNLQLGIIWNEDTFIYRPSTGTTVTLRECIYIPTQLIMQASSATEVQRTVTLVDTSQVSVVGVEGFTIGDGPQNIAYPTTHATSIPYTPGINAFLINMIRIIPTGASSLGNTSFTYYVKSMAQGTVGKLNFNANTPANRNILLLPLNT